MAEDTVESLRAELERLRVAAMAVAWNITDRWTCDAEMLAKMDALRAALASPPSPGGREGDGSVPNQGAASSLRDLCEEAAMQLEDIGCCEGDEHSSECCVPRLHEAVAAQHDTRADQESSQARSAPSAAPQKSTGEVVREIAQALRAACDKWEKTVPREAWFARGVADEIEARWGSASEPKGEP